MTCTCSVLPNDALPGSPPLVESSTRCASVRYGQLLKVIWNTEIPSAHERIGLSATVPRDCTASAYTERKKGTLPRFLYDLE